MIAIFGLAGFQYSYYELLDQHHVREYAYRGPLGEGLDEELDSFFRRHNDRLFQLLSDVGHSHIVETLRRHFAYPQDLLPLASGDE
jgi:hypothetical protein